MLFYMMKAIMLQNIGGLYQKFKKGYEKAYMECMKLNGQKQIEDDIKAEKSLAVIIYEVGNWLGEDCRKIPNIRKRR